MTEKLKQIQKELDSRNKTIKEVSQACHFLLVWVKAVIIFYNTFTVYKPIQQLVEHLTQKSEQMTLELQQTLDLLDNLKIELHSLNEKS